MFTFSISTPHASSLFEIHPASISIMFSSSICKIHSFVVFKMLPFLILFQLCQAGHSPSSQQQKTQYLEKVLCDFPSWTSEITDEIPQHHSHHQRIERLSAYRGFAGYEEMVDMMNDKMEHFTTRKLITLVEFCNFLRFTNLLLDKMMKTLTKELVSAPFPNLKEIYCTYIWKKLEISMGKYTRDAFTIVEERDICVDYYGFYGEYEGTMSVFFKNMMPFYSGVIIKNFPMISSVYKTILQLIRPDVKKLHFENCLVPFGVKLPEFSKLESFQFVNSISDLPIFRIKTLFPSSLEHLYITDDFENSKKFQDLELILLSLPNLKTLRLPHNNLTPANAVDITSAILSLQHLEHLDLSGNAIGDYLLNRVYLEKLNPPWIQLNLANTCFSMLASEIAFGMIAKLEVLNISGNPLASIDSILKVLPLRRLICSMRQADFALSEGKTLIEFVDNDWNVHPEFFNESMVKMLKSSILNFNLKEKLRLPQLENLSIDLTKVTIPTIEFIEAPNVTFLECILPDDTLQICNIYESSNGKINEYLYILQLRKLLSGKKITQLSLKLGNGKYASLNQEIFQISTLKTLSLCGENIQDCLYALLEYKPTDKFPRYLESLTIDSTIDWKLLTKLHCVIKNNFRLLKILTIKIHQEEYCLGYLNFKSSNIHTLNVAFTNKNENNDELLVKILKMCPHLANLTIKGRVTANAFSFTNAYPMLQKLYISGYEMTEDDSLFGSLSTAKFLTTVSVLAEEYPMTDPESSNKSWSSKFLFYEFSDKTIDIEDESNFSMLSVIEIDDINCISDVLNYTKRLSKLTLVNPVSCIESLKSIFELNLNIPKITIFNRQNHDNLYTSDTLRYLASIADLELGWNIYLIIGREIFQCNSTDQKVHGGKESFLIEDRRLLLSDAFGAKYQWTPHYTIKFVMFNNAD